MRLRLVMSDIAGKAFRGNDGKHSLYLEQTNRYHAILTGWFHDLPEPLQAHNVAMPNSASFAVRTRRAKYAQAPNFITVVCNIITSSQ
jgi:hypothetical protein